MLIRKIIIPSILLFISISAIADEYIPDWIFDVDYYQLPNGMKVTLKETTATNNVSIRLRVGYGAQDEPCGMRETAHFLEHMIFSGTTKYSSADLQAAAADYGIGWNAATYDDRTVFEMDVYSGYVWEALWLLSHITSSSVISEDEVDKTRDIIHRESGGERSFITRWLYEKGYMKSAGAKWAEDIDPLHCRNLELADDITRDKVLSAYQEWYIPNNMHLFVVGNFGSDIKDMIDEAFSGLESKELKLRQDKNWPIVETKKYTSSIKPLYDDETIGGYWYQLPPYSKEFYYDAVVFQEFLQEKFYEDIRLNHGLSYDPDVVFNSGDVGSEFEFNADFNNKDVKNGMFAINIFIKQSLHDGMTQEEIDRTIENILVKRALYNPTNASLADFYDYALFSFDGVSHYDNDEDGYASVTPESIRKFISIYLDKPAAVWVESPTFSIAQFLGLVLTSGIMILLLPVFVIIKLRKNRH